MNVSDLSVRLDHLERINQRLRVFIVGLMFVVVGLMAAVALRPSPVDAQPRVYAARSFQLTDDAGIVRGVFALGQDGQPVLHMWQGPGGELAGNPNPSIFLGIGSPESGGGTALQMGSATHGSLMIQTSQDGHWPSAALYPPGGQGPIWDTPYR